MICNSATIRRQKPVSAGSRMASVVFFRELDAHRNAKGAASVTRGVLSWGEGIALCRVVNVEKFVFQSAYGAAPEGGTGFVERPANAASLSNFKRSCAKVPAASAKSAGIVSQRSGGNQRQLRDGKHFFVYFRSVFLRLFVKNITKTASLTNRLEKGFDGGAHVLAVNDLKTNCRCSAAVDASRWREADRGFKLFVFDSNSMQGCFAVADAFRAKVKRNAATPHKATGLTQRFLPLAACLSVKGLFCRRSEKSIDLHGTFSRFIFSENKVRAFIGACPLEERSI